MQQQQQLQQHQHQQVRAASTSAPMSMQPVLSQPHIPYADAAHTSDDVASTAPAGTHAVQLQQTMMVPGAHLRMQQQQQPGMLGMPTANGGGISAATGMPNSAMLPGGVSQYATVMQAGMMMAPGSVSPKGGLALLHEAVQIASNPGSREGTPPIDGESVAAGGVGGALVADPLAAQLASASAKLAETTAPPDVLAAMPH